MELKDFLELFWEQLEETEKDEINPSTRFKDLGEWSSITALSVIAMVDDEFDVTIGAKEIMASDTVEDLYNLILQK